MERSLIQAEHEARFRSTIRKSPSLWTVKNVPSAVFWCRKKRRYRDLTAECIAVASVTNKLKPDVDRTGQSTLVYITANITSKIWTNGNIQVCLKSWISNIRLVLNYESFVLGDSPASEFYMLTFRNTLFHLHRTCKQEEFLSAYTLFHLHRWCKQVSRMFTPPMQMEHTECPARSAYKIQTPGNHQKKNTTCRNSFASCDVYHKYLYSVLLWHMILTTLSQLQIRSTYKHGRTRSAYTLVKHFIVQLMHTNYKILRLLK